MWSKPTLKELEKIPVYGTYAETPTLEITVHMKFFFAGSTWWIYEWDREDVFFGFAILNGDMICAEFGTVAFSELCEFSLNGFEIDRDTSWVPTKIKDIPELMKILRFQGYDF